MILSELCLLSALFVAPAEPTTPTITVSAHFAPQGLRASKNRPESAPAPHPTGGTPEPTIMLLVAGSVIGYGALRMRGRKAATATKA